MATCPAKFVPPAAADIRGRHDRAVPNRQGVSVLAPARVHLGEEIALRDGELWVAVHDASRALRVRCVSGYVWITQEGRAEDTVVGAGGLGVILCQGKVVVQALEDAIIRVEH